VKKTWATETVLVAVVVWIAASVQIFFRTGADAITSYEGVYNAMTTVVWMAVAANAGWKRISGGGDAKLRGQSDVPYNPDSD